MGWEIRLEEQSGARAWESGSSRLSSQASPVPRGSLSLANVPIVSSPRSTEYKEHWLFHLHMEIFKHASFLRTASEGQVHQGPTEATCPQVSADGYAREAPACSTSFKKLKATPQCGCLLIYLTKAQSPHLQRAKQGGSAKKSHHIGVFASVQMALCVLAQ